MSHGELEIWLESPDAHSYSVQMRFRAAGSETERGPWSGTVTFDHRALLEKELDAEAYGAELLQVLSQGGLAGRLVDTLNDCDRTWDPDRTRDTPPPLKIRLLIGPSARDLHGLRWETLPDPRTMTPLIMLERVHFSRYLTSEDCRPVKLRPRGELKMLVAVAAPTDAARFRLQPISPEEIRRRVEPHLGDLQATFLCAQGEATLAAILARLRDGYDILYLAAHGALVKGEPLLYLVNDAGAAAPTSGKLLEEGIRELDRPPFLAILSSCQSAGSGQTPDFCASAGSRDWDVLFSLGPRVCRAGVSAVVAMQGSISMKTEAAFTPVFFRELARDGAVDRAVSVARAGAKGGSDWWMPVLFSRLRGGRIWYEPGFADSSDAKDKWPAVVGRILAARRAGAGTAASRRPPGVAQARPPVGCTPVLGLELLEPYIGRIQDIASSWAGEQGYPLSAHDTEMMSRVAQFIDVKLRDRGHLRDTLGSFLVRRVVGRHRERLSPGVRDRLASVEEAPFIEELLQDLSGAHCRAGRDCSYHRLARLDLPLYLTTDPTHMLEAVLAEGGGKEPQSDVCRWSAELAEGAAGDQVYPPYGGGQPTPQRPLVFHLFGTIYEPRSLVISEDDHFDFLTGFVRYKEALPAAVKTALSRNTLIFAGIGIDDWSFRVLLRAFFSLENSALDQGAGRVHVAAQVEPQEGRLLDPAGAVAYLSQFVGRSNISLYWGDLESFLTDLARQLALAEPGAAS